MPLYEIDDGTKTRLLEAKNKAAARGIAAKSIKVEICTPARAHRLAARGIKIEREGDEAQVDIEDLPPGGPQ